MNLGRTELTCGMIRRGPGLASYSIIVAGGKSKSGLESSVEILDLISGSWRQGPKVIKRFFFMTYK